MENDDIGDEVGITGKEVCRGCHHMEENTCPKSCSMGLANELKALKAFTSVESPPKCFVRPATGAAVVYNFGDSSGIGFGNSTLHNDKL